MLPHRRFGTAATLFIAFCFFAMSLYLFVRDARSRSDVDVDEPEWVSASLSVAHKVDRGDFAPEDWSDDDLGQMSDLNPPGGKLMIGLPLLASYGGRAPQFRRVYDWPKSQATNAREGNLPPRELLLRARFVCSVISALALALVVVWAGQLGGPVAALTAGSLLLANRLFDHWAYRVVTDGAYLASIAGLAIACTGYLRAAPGKPRLRRLIAAGILIGFGSSVKVTAVFPEGLLVICAVIRASMRSGERLARRAALKQIAGCALVSLAVIYALNPSYWMDLRRIDIPAARAELTRLQETARRGQPDGAPGGLQKLHLRYPHLYNLVRPLGYPLMFVRWKGFTAGQAMVVPRAVRTPSQKLRDLSRLASSFPGEDVVGAAALALAVAKIRRRGLSDAVDAPFLLLAYCAIQVVFLLSLPLVFERYDLPAVIGGQAAAGWLGGEIVSTLRAGGSSRGAGRSG